MHPLSGVFPLPYVMVRVTRGAVVADRQSFAHPRCRTSQYCRAFVPLSVSLWNDLNVPVFDGVGLAGFKSRPNAFLLVLICYLFLSSTISVYLPSTGWLLMTHSLTDCSHRLPALHC